MDAIADFVQIAQIDSTAANNASLDRRTSDPARADRLLGRSIKNNIERGILEDG
ncbi:MAG: hypothetical protein WCG85_04125 [Polyangia bacterium]